MFTFLKKVVNSQLTPRSLFERVIKDEQFDALLAVSKRPATLGEKITRKLRKLVYFWPSIVDAESWVKGGKGSYRDPNNFISMWHGVDDLMLDKVVGRVSSADDPILDLGCCCGRHLEYLHDKGLSNLSGVDVMETALELFKKLRPAIYEKVTTHHDFFQRFLSKCDDNRYDLLYSSGATIELVHPSFDIVRNMCRVTKNHIVLAVYEDKHNYPRFYVREFAKHGFVLVESSRPIENTSISLLVFQDRTFRKNAGLVLESHQTDEEGREASPGRVTANSKSSESLWEKVQRRLTRFRHHPRGRAVSLGDRNGISFPEVR